MKCRQTLSLCPSLLFLLLIRVCGARTAEERLDQGVRALHRAYGTEFRFIQIGAYFGATLKDPIFVKAIENVWSGILVEPVPNIFHQLRANYQKWSGGDVSRFSFENSAICDSDQENVQFYFLSPKVIDAIVGLIGENRRSELPNWAAQASSLSRERMVKNLHTYFQLSLEQALTIVDMAKITVPCVTYDTLLRKYGSKLRGKNTGLGVHYVHIDAEGYDGNIVNQILASIHNLPKILCYESHLLAKTSAASRLTARLASNKYICEELNRGDDTCCYHQSYISTTLVVNHDVSRRMADSLSLCQPTEANAFSACMAVPRDQKSFLIGTKASKEGAEKKTLLSGRVRLEWVMGLSIRENMMHAFVQDLSIFDNATFHLGIGPADLVLKDERMFSVSATRAPWYDSSHHRLGWYFGANFSPVDVSEGEVTLKVVIKKVTFGHQKKHEVTLGTSLSVRLRLVPVEDEHLEHFDTSEPLEFGSEKRKELSKLHIVTKDHIQRYLNMVYNVAFDSLHSRRRQLSMLEFGVTFYLQKMMEYVILGNIPGDFVEAGAYRGGLCAIMAAIITAYGEQGKRKVWCADSFTTFPDLEHPMDIGLHPSDIQLDMLPVDDVQQKLSMMDFSVAIAGSDDSALIQLVPGFFNETLPTPGMLSDKIAFLHVDSDLYTSVTDTLNAVGRGGILAKGAPLVIDDYNWHSSEAAKKATLDFRRKHGMRETLFCMDKGPVFWFHKGIKVTKSSGRTHREKHSNMNGQRDNFDL